MLEVKRKKDESFESLLRRFNRRLLQSGKILEIKQKRYYEKKMNKNQRRTSALVRNKYREKIEYLKKTGKLLEEELDRNRNKKLKIKIKK